MVASTQLLFVVIFVKDGFDDGENKPCSEEIQLHFFLSGSLWKILTGKKEGEDIAFGRVIHGAKTGEKLLPCYHSYRSDYHRLGGRGWLYPGHLHGSAKGWQFRKILLTKASKIYSLQRGAKITAALSNERR